VSFETTTDGVVVGVATSCEACVALARLVDELMQRVSALESDSDSHTPTRDARDGSGRSLAAAAAAAGSVLGQKIIAQESKRRYTIPSRTLAPMGNSSSASSLYSGTWLEHIDTSLVSDAGAADWHQSSSSTGESCCSTTSTTTTTTTTTTTGDGAAVLTLKLDRLSID
jgi:hypothetical protein